jgi:predicted transcriptional regulator
MIKMITFSCKKITEEELIRCSFNLNKTEYNVLIFLLRNDRIHTILQISKAMKLERTTIQKAIKNLVEKGLAKRIQKNLSKGGYIFLYKPNNKEEIKSKMKRLTYKWYKHVEETIDKF